MENESRVAIRKYEAQDKSQVRLISCMTALMGQPSNTFFDDDEIFADALTLYFTDYEPESCFVAEHDSRIIGYLLGAKDTKRMEKIFASKIALSLFIKALSRGIFFSKRNIKFLSHIFLSLLKGEFKAPVFSADYPATLHINILQEYRAQGVGSKLINVYLDYLKENSIKGVKCFQAQAKQQKKKKKKLKAKR